jgi:hypothetical protein
MPQPRFQALGRGPFLLPPTHTSPRLVSAPAADEVRVNAVGGDGENGVHFLVVIQIHRRLSDLWMLPPFAGGWGWWWSWEN